MGAHQNWPRCYAPPELWRDGFAYPDEGECHHLLNVLRCRAGDGVIVFDGAGREAEARLKLEGSEGGPALEVVGELPPRLPSVKIDLVPAVPKGGRMEMVLQKATELGVAAIHPVLSERTIVRIKDDKQARKKMKRWNDVLLGAAKQCGVAAIPHLEPVREFKDFIGSYDPSAPMLICSLQDDALPLREVVADIDPAVHSPITVLVGPEGDFTTEEYRLARNAGAIPVSLGNLVLRTDTAALYILSVLRYSFSVPADPVTT